MPLLDIVTARPSFPNHILALSAQTPLHNKFVFGNGRNVASGWESFQIQKRERERNAVRIELQQSVLMIRAVATLEPRVSTNGYGGHFGQENGQPDVDCGGSSQIHNKHVSEDAEELDEREKLRRMRISKANRGKTPWNKGRKHSAETLQRIKERTRLAMQDPKVKMKLINLGHAQSKETRINIGNAVRMGWERRRRKLAMQETCHFEWQNLIAEASRRGFVGEEELQWNSYKILDELLQKEWLESVELRKKMPGSKTGRRAPKSLEQRRKISEAISAKWADPAYRERVCFALSKYHGTPVGTERKPRRRLSGERKPRTWTPAKKKAKDTDSDGSVTKSPNYTTKLKQSNVAMYKDPLASSKLEMIKNIRAQREAAETKKIEAVEQAKLLIVEAEKAAKALQVAAMRSPVAQASLVETRKLIAEAIDLIQSIEVGQIGPHEKGKHSSSVLAESATHAEVECGRRIQGLNQLDHIKINGREAVGTSRSGIENFDFDKFNFHDLLNAKNEVLPVNGEGLHRTGTIDYGLFPSELDSIIKQSGFTGQLSQHELNGNNSHGKELGPEGGEFQSRKGETSPTSVKVTKKWVRGRLIEVIEGQ